MARAQTREMQRLRYWQGQTLSSRDFSDEDLLNSLRRRLHVIALHGVAGISSGLEVKQASANPLELTVACGLAYDCAGRALLLQSGRDITAPTEDALLVLRLRQHPAQACNCPVTDMGCTPAGNGRLDNDVELVWLPEGPISPLGVVLTRVTAAGGVDATFLQRKARPLARPRMARGTTIPGNTPWERWEIFEPDGHGGLQKKVIGVQTHIDTSAAGFTETPRYFATLDGANWDLTKTEFAPIFFPHVAEPSVDGFTFRLLMTDTARRRYPAFFRFTRAISTSFGAGNELRIEAANGAVLRKGDVIVQLRPRGDSAIVIESQLTDKLTLSAPLPGPVEPGKTLLALGNLPRMSEIKTVGSGDPMLLVSFTAPVAIRKNDILVRFSDQSIAAVAGTSGGRLKIADLGWIKTDPIGFATPRGAVGVSTASTAAGAATTTIVLNKLTHNLDAGLFAVGLDIRNKPVANAVKIVSRTGATIHVEVLAPAALSKLTQMALVRSDITVEALQPETAGVSIKVASVEPFREGDIVAADTDLSSLSVVQNIDVSKNTLTLSAPFTASPNAMLVAGNWLAATSVEQPGAAATPLTITVGRSDAVPARSYVAVRIEDGFSTPVGVNSASGTSVTLQTAIPNLNRHDTLAIGAFPGLATVMVQDGNQIRIAESNVFSAGEVIVNLNALVPGPAPLAVVESMSGDLVTLRSSLGTLAPGTRLGVVNFRDVTVLQEVTAGNSKKIKVDRELVTGTGDFVSVFTHFEDNSSPGYVQSVQGAIVNLSPISFNGDGIVPADWIDGGLLGAASLSASQPFLRLESADGLQASGQGTVYGLDLLTGQQVQSPVYFYVLDGAAGQIYIRPSRPDGVFRFRPETLALFSVFNADFPAAFATFAQKQKLAVSWAGCQQEFTGIRPCFGVKEMGDPCAPKSEK